MLSTDFPSALFWISLIDMFWTHLLRNNNNSSILEWIREREQLGSPIMHSSPIGISAMANNLFRIEMGPVQSCGFVVVWTLHNLWISPWCSRCAYQNFLNCLIPSIKGTSKDQSSNWSCNQHCWVWVSWQIRHHARAIRDRSVWIELIGIACVEAA